MLDHVKQQWTFRTRVKKYDTLPPLVERVECGPVIPTNHFT